MTTGTIYLYTSLADVQFGCICIKDATIVLMFEVLFCEVILEV